MNIAWRCRWAALLVAALVGFGCKSKPDSSSAEPDFVDLEPYANRFATASELYEPQPRRQKPRALALAPDGQTLYVALQGSIDHPNEEVVGVDLSQRRVTERYRVGRNPTGLAMHPDGRHLVVANRFSNYLSVIDLHTGSVERQESDFYLVRLGFSADGARLYATNQWRDTLQAFDIERRGQQLAIHRVGVGPEGWGVPVGRNPRDLLVTDDGSEVLVAAIGGLTISRVDAARLAEVDLDADAGTTDFGAPDGITRLDVGAPPNGMAITGQHLYVATTSAATGHPAVDGPDTNGSGTPGDGTPNVGFQDVQNELAVFLLEDLSEVVRYTSDSICCYDFRDVHPRDELGHLLAPRSRWIVGGALPEQITPLGGLGQQALAVTYSGSNQAQRFTLTDDGALEPADVIETPFMPTDIVANVERGELYASAHLADELVVIDADAFEVIETIALSGEDVKAFPATDAEIGELLFFAGADFSTDGDLTCAHCHPEQGNIGKAFNVPGLDDRRGSRMTPHSRGLFDTRPWQFAGGLDETINHEPLNEFAREVNFCCYDYRPTPVSGTLGQRDCPTNPPVVCDQQTYPGDILTQDHFFLMRAERVLGRRRSPGGVLDTRLDFLGMARLLGLFLIHEPALLPNPNRSASADARRGREIFFSAKTGCAGCHPAPGFTVTYEHNPLDLALQFPMLITPPRGPDGENLSRISPRFLRNFPMARQLRDGEPMFNPPTLLGLWERATPLLHDGRARSLREALAPPGHPALLPGELGHNHRDGVPDTHGGTSHLTAAELADLIAFLNTL